MIFIFERIRGEAHKLAKQSRSGAPVFGGNLNTCLSRYTLFGELLSRSVVAELENEENNYIFFQKKEGELLL